MKNVTGLAAPGRCAPAKSRNANKALGTTQHKPPSTAENIAARPPSSAATKPATAVAMICRETMRNIFIFFALSQMKPVTVC
jgi:hypothetical protein